MTEDQLTNALAPFDAFSASLAEFKKRYDDVQYDMDDPTQNKQARSDQRAIGGVIAELDRTHKKIKSPLLEQVNLVDGCRKEIKDDLLGVQLKIKTQIADHEAKLQAEIDRVQELVDSLRMPEHIGAPGQAPTPSEVQEVIDRVEDVMVTEQLFGDRHDEARTLQDATLAELFVMLTAAEKREADEAELERHRKEQTEREQYDRDEKLKADAKADAERDAQERLAAAEKSRQEAEAKAARDKADATKRAQAAKEKAKRDAAAAKAKAEADKVAAVEAERQRAADAKAEADALAERARAEEEARKADAEHITAVNELAAAAFNTLVEQAKAESGSEMVELHGSYLVEMIAAGKIPNVTLNY